MLDTQSTFALPNRLTQIALYPNLNQYLRDVDNEGTSVCQTSSWTVVLNCLFSGIKFCDELKLDFFKNYTRDKCQQECRYKKIMEKCNCHPPYLPAWMDLPRCTFDQHSVSKTSFEIFKVYLLVIFKRSSKNL